jgi:transposase
MPILGTSGDIKKLRLLARRDDVDLWFLDECHFQQHGSRSFMWVPPEDVDPIVFLAPTRKSIGIMGAVCAADGRLVTMTQERFNASSFLFFLEKLLRHRRSNRRLIVVLDNARYHKASDIQPWLWDHRDLLRLDFLPPYSPELNNMERVWKLTRRLCTHNRFFPILRELLYVVTEQLARWQKPNRILHQLCAVN